MTKKNISPAEGPREEPYSAVDEEDTVPQDSSDPIYRFVNKSTQTEFPIEQVFHEDPEVKFGDVIEIHPPDSKIDYYSVESVEEGEITTVYLIRARNSLWKSLLILAILGVSWFVIEYIVKLIF